MGNKLWKDSTKVHHAFKLIDQESGRSLASTLEVHTLELGMYNLRESELATASMLACWLFWLLHADEYEADELLKLFPQVAIRIATGTITTISLVTEDKAMYDAREKAIRDYQWAIKASRNEGKIEGKMEGVIEGVIEGEIKGEIKLIRTLQEILRMPVSEETELQSKTLAELQKQTAVLQERIRARG